LQKEVNRLQKVVQSTGKPERFRATRAVVDSLQVVNSSGKMVAEIDRKGNLFCRTRDTGDFLLVLAACTGKPGILFNLRCSGYGAGTASIADSNKNR
jgi:hypothetical protein